MSLLPNQQLSAVMLVNAPIVSTSLDSNKTVNDLIDKIKSAIPDPLGKVNVFDIELRNSNLSDCYFSFSSNVSGLTENFGNKELSSLGDNVGTIDNPLILSYVDRSGLI